MDKAIQLYYIAIDEDIDDSDVEIPTPQQWLDDIKVRSSWLEFKKDIGKMKGQLRDVFTNNSFYRYMDYMFGFVDFNRTDRTGKEQIKCK